MRTDIFLPQTLKVGFQERHETYTGKLAYVTYLDTKGVLRKEKSWESWRSKKIDPIEVENVPTSGFVLNKKAGGYSTGWNHRQTYVRIYDPRGFEFEITIQNLLYILENTNSIKGKGLEGEFVYGWSGADLILIPTSAPDYQELAEFNEVLHEKKKLKGKDLKVGATYLTKQNKTVVYLGRFESYGRNINDPEGKKYFFREINDYEYVSYLLVKTLGEKIIGVVSEECVSNYAELMATLEESASYSPYDPSKDEYISYELEEFKTEIEDRYCLYFFNENKQAFQVRRYYGDEEYSVKYDHSYQDIMKGSAEQIFEKYKPMYVNKYLENGKIYEKKSQRIY